MRKKFECLEALDKSMHNKMMNMFRQFLLVGGLPDAVNSYLEEKNIRSVRDIQSEIHDYYAADALLESLPAFCMEIISAPSWMMKKASISARFTKR